MARGILPTEFTESAVLPMRYFSSVCLSLALAFASVTPAHALDLAGVRVASRASQGNLSLVLNGAGLRSFLMFDIYVLALYLPEPVHDAHSVLDNDMPRQVRITLLHDVSADHNVELLRRGLDANNSAQTLAAIQGQVEQFLDLIHHMGSFPKGSVIQFDYLPSAGTQVWLNHHLAGSFAGEAFNRAILRIWLGDHPVQPSLKAALLGE